MRNFSVYQSNKLIEASYQMPTIEQKLLRVVASTVKKGDENLQACSFNVTELGKFLKINEKNIYRELDKATSSLMSRTIKIRMDKKNWSKYSLFQFAKCSGGMLKIKINDSLRDFYVDLKEYTKYKLENILKFKSKHSFRFYELLKQYEKLEKRIIKLDELKIFLGFTNKQYKVYSDFKNRVLLPSISEINSLTDLIITFNDVKYGKKIGALEFFINKKTNISESYPNLLENYNKSEYALNIQKKIEDIIGDNVTLEKINEWVKLKKENIVNYYLENWHHFNKQNKKSVAGFFVMAVDKQINIPKEYKALNYNDKSIQQTNYEQRNYDEEDLEVYYWQPEHDL